MGIGLERVRKIRLLLRRDFNNFFFYHFNSSIPTPDDSIKTGTNAEIEFELGLSKGKSNTSISHSLNQANCFSSEPASTPFAAGRTFKVYSEMVTPEKENVAVETSKSSVNLIQIFINYSLSSLKEIYPQNWKTKFVHLSEKSNLLVRSDNNTGFSLLKVLQTTTI